MRVTSKLTLIVVAWLCHPGDSSPFSFPEGRSAKSTSVNGDGAIRPPTRQESFEGRSIRGGDQSDRFPALYSRYNVYEHEANDRYTQPTLRTTLATAHRYTTSAPQRTTRPNAYFNRLPPVRNDEPIQAEPEQYDSGEDEEDVGEEETDVPVKPVNVQYGGGGGGGGGSVAHKPTTINNLLYNFNDKFGGLTNLFGEHRHKFKFKRRRPGQPCIPYSLFHKLKYGRDLNGNAVDPKTLLPNLNLVLADLNYYAPNNNYNGHESDTGVGGSGATFNNHFYDAVGGYPCEGTTFGGVGNKPLHPFKPFKPHGGPLGFFGQGGLFDWVSSADAVQSDEGAGGTGNRPQVVFNLNDAIDTVATNWKPGENFQMVMGVIADFITQVAGGAAAPVVGAADDVRKINREFFSLFG